MKYIKIKTLKRYLEDRALPLKISSSKKLKPFFRREGYGLFIGQIITQKIYKKLHCKRE